VEVVAVNKQEAGHKGGTRCFELYGSDFYRRISKGRPRRTRFTAQEMVMRPPGRVAKGTTSKNEAIP